MCRRKVPTVQEALNTKDAMGKDIDGAVVFRERLLPELAQWADTYQQPAQTQAAVYRDCTTQNTLYKSLYLNTVKEIKDAEQCRADGRKMPPAEKVRAPVNPQAAPVGKLDAVLAHEDEYVVPEITHYHLRTEDNTFFPVHGPRSRTVTWRAYRGHCLDAIQKEVDVQLHGLTIQAAYMDIPWGYHKERNEDKDPPSAEDVAKIVRKLIECNRHNIFTVALSLSMQQLSPMYLELVKLPFVAEAYQVVWTKKGSLGGNIPADSGASVCHDIENLLFVHIDKSNSDGKKKPTVQAGHFPAGRIQYMKAHPTLHPHNVRYQTLKAAYVSNKNKYHVTKGGNPPLILNMSEKSQDFCSVLVSLICEDYFCKNL